MPGNYSSSPRLTIHSRHSRSPCSSPILAALHSPQATRYTKAMMGGQIIKAAIPIKSFCVIIGSSHVLSNPARSGHSAGLLLFLLGLFNRGPPCIGQAVARAVITLHKAPERQAHIAAHRILGNLLEHIQRLLIHLQAKQFLPVHKSSDDRIIYNDCWIVNTCIYQFYNRHMPDVRSWLNQKFLEWQNEQGQPMKQKEFAAWLGVKPQTYSSWINDGVPPTGDNLYKLADKLGFEIYTVLDTEPPSKMIQSYISAQEAYNALPPEEQQAFIDRINQIIQDTYTEFGGKRIK